MNKIVLSIAGILLLLAVSIPGNSKGNPDDSKHGIKFQEGSWNSALELAKSENKLIFLDVFASWCGPCKKMKAKTFTDKEVGEFFNSNFINVSLDGDTKEGSKIADQYNVRGYPSLIFVNGDGKVVNRTAGYMNEKQILYFGQQALKK
jgi:thioredoxin